ncbi:MAG: type II CRISPR-associated endonuclease Cas1 [Acidobacteria bacterium]|nr:type II CRISPR-associated endonuclease Cas1 [Acidobacteriota bacterium]
MTDRIIDLSAQPARLSIRNKLLVGANQESELFAIPCAEIAAVIVSHRQVTYTHAVLGALAEGGGILVSCDDRSRPAAMMLPLNSHWIQADRFRKQAALGLPSKKRIWQQIVRAKIRAQSRLLIEAHGDDDGLSLMAPRVLSGDGGNYEAIAARRYWTLLFPESGFRRWDEEDPRHHLLNYGYAVLRAIVSRAICGTGLHPTFSIFHKNIMNAFALADDFMEPFRPLVDRYVWQRTSDGLPLELNHECKQTIISSVSGRLLVEGESRTVFDVASRICQSFVKVLEGKSKALWLPDWQPDLIG